MTAFLSDIADKLHTLRKQYEPGSPDYRGNGGPRAVHDHGRDLDAAHVRLKRLHVTLGLSAIATGLDQISRGRAEEGLRVARHGLDYLRSRIDEAQS